MLRPQPQKQVSHFSVPLVVDECEIWNWLTSCFSIALDPRTQWCKKGKSSVLQRKGWLDELREQITRTQAHFKVVVPIAQVHRSWNVHNQVRQTNCCAHPPGLLFWWTTKSTLFSFDCQTRCAHMTLTRCKGKLFWSDFVWSKTQTLNMSLMKSRFITKQFQPNQAWKVCVFWFCVSIHLLDTRLTLFETGTDDHDNAKTWDIIFCCSPFWEKHVTKSSNFDEQTKSRVDVMKFNFPTINAFFFEQVTTLKCSFLQHWTALLPLLWLPRT